MKNNDSLIKLNNEFIVNSLKDHSSLEKVFQQIQDKQIDVFSYFDLLFQHFQPFIHNFTLIESYQIILCNHKIKDANSKNINYIQEKVKPLISQNYCYFMELFSIIINNFFNQETTRKIYNQKIKNNAFLISNTLKFNDFYASYNIFVDNNYNFCYKKIYSRECSFDNINNEKNILKYKFSKNNFKTPIFIVHSNFQNEQQVKICEFPYYPNECLSQYLSKKISIENKLIIILEIAIGLQQLYDNGYSHLNLCNSSIFVNSQKDAYIAQFIYDKNLESTQTKTVSYLYFRHPDLIKTNNSVNNDYGENKDKNIIYDIYSFGVLVYYIVSQIEIECLFGNSTRKERIEKLASDQYYDFLFEKYKSNKFDNDYGIDGIQQLIQKCMNSEYTDFYQIINDLNIIIKKTPYYEEIEHRIANAMNPETFKCSISDLILNYYYDGNENSKKYLEIFLNWFLDNQNNKINYFEEYDVITAIFIYLGFQNIGFGNDQIFLNECFNEIIRRNVFSKLNREQFNLNDYEQKLMELSKNTNINVQKEEDYYYDYDYEEDKKKDIKEDIEMNKYLYKEPIIEDISNVFPITTLDKFKEFSKIYPNNLDEMTLLYIYNICKEVQIIHSHGLYHGEIKEESIGIYYDSKEQIFIPSILLYYYYYQTRKNKSKTQKKRKERDIDIVIEHKQNKDILNLIKLIKKHVSNTNLRIERIYEQGGIDYIVMYLYDFIQNHYNNDNYSPILYRIEQLNDYSKYQLTFRILADIYLKYKVSEDISYIFLKYQKSNDEHNEPFLNIEDTFKEILNFSNEFLNIVEDDNSNTNNNDQQQSIVYIINQCRQNNDKISNEYYSDVSYEDMPQNNQSTKTDKQIYKNQNATHQKIVVSSFYKYKKKESDARNERIIHKDVYRTIHIQYMTEYSIKFLLKRYIKMLYPNSNYKIKLSIESKKYNFKIIEELITKLGCKCGFENDNFYFYVNNIGSLPKK